MCGVFIFHIVGETLVRCQTFAFVIDLHELEDPEPSGDGWHAAYAVLHRIQDSKKILIWRTYAALFHENFLLLKRFQGHLDKIVVNQVKNLQAF